MTSSMSDDLSKVDLGKPIEAWNPITNKTVPMRLKTGAGGGLVTEDCPDPSTSNTWWRQDGTNRCVGSPWRIRNVAEVHRNSEAPSDDIAKRMEALVRRMALADICSTQTDVVQQSIYDARAIVALLPEPVDADLVECRKVLAERYPDSAQFILAGHWDKNAVGDSLACVQHIRALERDSREG